MLGTVLLSCSSRFRGVARRFPVALPKPGLAVRAFRGDPNTAPDPCFGVRRTLVASTAILGAASVFLLGSLLASARPAEAQYFGRNKVQYDRFDTEVLSTPHFDIYFYEGMEEAMGDVSRMSERWYERLARLFQHEFADRRPLIFYADHPDFQQTNTISGRLGEGTGGVTEGLKNRVILPLTGSYASTDHVLGHELVHAFQYNLAQSRRGGGMQGLAQVPLWMIEGMAEYLSVGREDPLTAMWLRDAILRDDFPTLEQMTTESRFFPYRFGQAFWTHVGGRYGDERVVSLLRSAMRVGWRAAIEAGLGVPVEELSEDWRRSVEAHFRPLMENRTSPGEVGTLLMSPETGAGNQNVAPSISPDGRRMIVMSEKDLFSFDLYLADARTGEVLRTLASAGSDRHMDALRFIDSSGAWSPDGSRIAIVAFAQGRNEIVVLDAESGDVRSRLTLSESIGEVTSPSWSPDGEHLVFSGQVGGITDLFLVHIATDQVTRLTNDRHADLQPVFSPSGNRIAFVTDRGPETDFELLTYGRERIALYDMEDGRIEVLELFGNVRHINPQFSPDGRSLYFISDPDGFSDIYRVDLAARDIERVTRIATAVSGITAESPAMSVARETGTVVFSVFDEFQFHLYSVDSRDVPAARIDPGEMDPTGRMIASAPSPSSPRSRVERYLGDPLTGLAEPGAFVPGEAGEYDSSLGLDYVGQPSVGVGTDQFGNFVTGSAAAYFSDMLGNRLLGVAVQAQGTLKDLGGQFMYQNLERRWNWGARGGRVPYLQIGTRIERHADTNYTELTQSLYREYRSDLSGTAAYPFSTTRRMEFDAGVSRYSFDIERDVLIYDEAQRLVDHRRESGNEARPDPLNLAYFRAALVGDNSYFGFTSPVRGGRYRLEVGTTAGTLDFHTVNLDYRRYFNPVTEFTIALRGLHQARYGSGLYSSSVLRPLFLGWETYIRGYSSYSFDVTTECSSGGSGSQCPEFDRLFGHRVAVANLELRLPLLGVDRFGLFKFGLLPTELVGFVDAGLAWDEENPPVLEWHRASAERIPVFSSGVGARTNLMGFLVVEVYYVMPWQRPGRGAHWGFQIAPGW